MSPSLNQLRDRLEKEAGVSPSINWLNQCLRHINGKAANDGGPIGQIDADAIWDQIRYSDLRNVIREDPNDNNAGASSNSVTAAVQLRRAINDSKMNNNGSANNNNRTRQPSSQVCLPNNFQLMIQLEEVIDATMNSEQRLASMGGNTNVATLNSGNNGNNNYGQGNRSEKWRSLKMIFSDGYYSNGCATSPLTTNGNDQENKVILYAMETTPITNLSTASVPGTKILLHGPISIRRGLLQLSDENAFVIGGQVPSWKEIWTKAREKAQRDNGLGVDPTIKALCWNPLMGDEEEADEGEGESGDVTAPRAPPPPPPVVPRPQQVPVPNQTLPVITPNHSTENRTHYQQGPTNNNMSAPLNSSFQNTNTNNNAAKSRAAGNFRQTTIDAYPKQNRGATTNPYQRSSQDNTTTQQTTAVHNSNPYQQKQQPQQQQQQVSNPYATTTRQRQQPQQEKTNPYASLRPSPPSELSSTSTTTSLARSLTTTGIDESTIQDDTVDLTTSPSDVGDTMDTSSTSQVVISIATPRNNSTPNSNANNSSKSGLSGILSISEFKALMQSLRHDRVLYDENYGKEIIVLCKISPGNENKEFNIVKEGGGDKKSKVKKKDKVSFVQVLCKSFYIPYVLFHTHHSFNRNINS